MNKNKKQLLDRMNYIKGHIEGNRRMIENDKYCIDVISQNKAVIKAIEKVNQIILKNHLDGCVTTAIKSNKTSRRKKVIDELLEIYKYNK